MTHEFTNDEIEELGDLKDIDRNFLKVRNNGLLLTDNQVSCLQRHNIDPSKCQSATELLYMIDNTDADEDDELSYLADQIAENNYYQNTRE